MHNYKNCSAFFFHVEKELVDDTELERSLTAFFRSNNVIFSLSGTMPTVNNCS